MRVYAYKCMEELASELCAGLMRLRRGYVEAADALMRIIEPDKEYPYEFVAFRVTGYRPSGRNRELAGSASRSAGTADPGSPGLAGKALRADLQRLIFDICDGFELRAEDCNEPVYDTPSLARRFNVSTKTIQRWRRRGLPARRLVFPDGKRRVAMLESSVQWFSRRFGKEISRSMRFTQMSPPERADIIRRARRMASFTNCGLSEVARRIARKTGRALETIRYTIRNYDQKHPDQAIFAYLLSPLGEREKAAIYRGFLRGIPVSSLAEKCHRTRGSVYRIVNEMRARQLLKRPIHYVYNKEFDLPDADRLILSGAPGQTKPGPKDGKVKPVPKPPADLPPYLRALYDVPLLDADTERDMFRRYNYLKFKADKLRNRIDVDRVRTSQLKTVETLLVRANGIKNRIIRANLRLVVSIAKKHVGGAQTLFELISDGNVSLMRAVEKFDYFRGFRFSTYASWAIMRNFARSVPRERYLLDRFATGHDEVLDIAASLRIYDPNEMNVGELRESINVMLAQLSSMERSILVDHFGLDADGRAKTLEQLGNRLGISKERVRQIEIQAIKKLRNIMSLESSETWT